MMNILITAGPTREPIDPIRFISNFSTGWMGYTLAIEARKRRHNVILISGPSPYPMPDEVKGIFVETARQMKKETEKIFNKIDCLIMASAVSDWRPRRLARRKLKSSNKRWYLELVKNPDILKTLGRRKKKKLMVGFALETENLIKNAYEKLKKKNLDLIVANLKDGEASPFGKGRTSVSIINEDGEITDLKNKKKEEVGSILLDKIEEMWENKKQRG